MIEQSSSTAEVRILDTSAAQPDPPLRLIRAGEIRYAMEASRTHRAVRVRPPAQIDAICLHQTAFTFGPHADEAKRLDRAHDIPIHAVAFRTGVVALPYPLTWYLYHGNGWNRRSLGLEIEGHFCGRTDDPSTLARREDLESTGGQTPDALDELTLATARRAVYELVTRGRALGCPITKLVAHRQSSSTREADPGELIWKHVGLEYAVAVLGLEALPTEVITGGRPIPEQWDPAQHGVPY